MAEEREPKSEATSATAAFDRDFGYLAKFLDALGRRASSFDGPRRDRFVQLLDGLPERFAEIRALLEGTAAKPAETKREAAGSPSPSTTPPPPPAAGLTVGSLIRSHKNDDS